MSKGQVSPRDTIKIVRPPLSRTFDVPTSDDLLKVFEGDSVKLMFKGGTNIERMWVTVTQAGKMDRWEGILDNDPVLLGVASRIKHGDQVQFHPYDVIDIDLHKRYDQREIESSEPEQVILPTNDLSKPWYKNPQITVPMIVGIIGAISTIIAALL